MTVRHPIGLEREMFRLLRPVIAHVEARAAAGWPTEAIRRELAIKWPALDIERRLRRVARATVSHTINEFAREIGEDPSTVEVLAGRPRMADTLTAELLRGYTRTVEGLLADIDAERVAEAEAAARLDAFGDAVGKALRRVKSLARRLVTATRASTAKTVATALGIPGYVWTSQLDARVRPLHRKIHGEFYTWLSGHPTEGHPGEPYNCRCVAQPVT